MKQQTFTEWDAQRAKKLSESYEAINEGWAIIWFVIVAGVALLSLI